MLFLSIVRHYLLWHYTRAFKELFHVWLNLIWFTVNFFSIPQLMRSWISPWKRITEDKGRSFNLEDLAGFVIIGFLSRFVGFIIRTAIIVLGLIALSVLVGVGFATYILWVGMPVLIITGIILGITLVFG